MLERLADAGCLIVRDGAGWKLEGRPLPDDLVQVVKQRWPELVELLEIESAAIRAARRQAEREASTVRCPWCKSRALADGLHAGLWCLDCERLAWIALPDGGIVRADHKDDVRAEF